MIARHLADAGHDVAVHYHRNAAGAAETAGAITASGRRAHLIKRDLAVPDAVQLDLVSAGVLEEATQALGPLQVIVLNAWRQDVTAWPDLDTAAWDAMHDAGFRPAAALMRAAAARLSPGGVIVTIGSIEGLRAAPGHTAYAVSKAALHHLTAAAAFELGPAGIRVVGVAPGLIDRPGLGEDWPEGVQRWAAASALGRPVTADEVAATVAFLASPAASGLTGITVPVDAGWSAAPAW